MYKSTLKLLAASVIVISAGMSSPANAACVNSHWAKVSGNGLANNIRGRQCGANMSVRLLGIVDTGWIAMSGFGNSFSATFVGSNVSTKINMNTNGGQMHVSFQHTDNNGAVSFTQANYKLLSLN